MRFVPSALFASALLIAGASQAAVSSVDVTIGPRLQAKVATLGQRDLDDLAATLRSTVEDQLRRDGQFNTSSDGDHIRLVIEDAKPNRPTSGQIDHNQALSLRSLGVGGAEVSGTRTTASGTQNVIHEKWFETDFRNERGAAVTTWSDAEWVFDKVARDLAKQQLANR
jgi:hypothetical protein